MRSAPRALAPSHPLHVMPPRITRNSHRPRASDRTMVASEATSLACRSLQLDSIVTISRAIHEHGQQAKLLQRSETTVGWISRKTLHSGRGGAFFLTSLFIELIVPVLGEQTAQSCANACLHQLFSPLLATSVLPVRRSELSAIGSMMHCSAMHSKVSSRK